MARKTPKKSYRRSRPVSRKSGGFVWRRWRLPEQRLKDIANKSRRSYKWTKAIGDLVGRDYPAMQRQYYKDLVDAKKYVDENPNDRQAKSHLKRLTNYHKSWLNIFGGERGRK